MRRSEKTKCLLAALLVAAVGAVSGSCALFGPPPPTIKKWVEAQPSINFQSPVTKSGVTIEVKAIHSGNYEQFPRLMGEVDYTNNNVNPPTSGTSKVNVFGGLPVAFQLKIANQTGHVIRFTGAIIKLADAAGNLYEPLSKDDLEGLWMGLQGKTDKGIQVTSVSRITAVVKQLKLLTPNTEVLPDYTTEVYVAFDPVMAWSFTTSEIQAKLKALEQVKLTLYELVTETDAAGNATAKEKFEWAFDMVEKQETVQQK